MSALPQAVDVVVVGAGSGGCVVARRLTDAGASVLLLEAGGPDVNPAIQAPDRVFELWGSEEDWAYVTAPQAGAGGRAIPWPRGKVLGGSSALNGMVYIRGHRTDYDSWAYAGNEGWAYADVLPLFKRSEDFDQGPSEFHGIGGPLRVTTRYEPHPMIAAAVAASQEAGIPYNPDHNGAESDGVSFVQLNVRAGKRDSASTAFVDPVRDADNLTVATHTRAQRLLLENGRCVGVEVVRDGAVETVRATHEVVVCAGTIESPKLLLLSGIGNGDDLRALGLGVSVHLPGVGQNLHDHAMSPVIYSAARPVPDALPGLTQLHGHLFARSRPGLIGPDTQPLFFHLPMYLPGMEGPANGFTLCAGLVRPASRGSLRLASARLDDAPVIDPRMLACEADVDALEFSLAQCREIASRPALKQWIDAELYPGQGVRMSSDVRDYIRATAITYHHQVGTCKMGIDELAVVDPELRVRGVEGLRVADASIMPSVSSGNTHAPVLMIAERCSDLVAGAMGLSARAAREVGVGV
jgi:choline dehydrogenase